MHDPSLRPSIGTPRASGAVAVVVLAAVATGSPLAGTTTLRAGPEHQEAAAADSTAAAIDLALLNRSLGVARSTLVSLSVDPTPAVEQTALVVVDGMTYTLQLQPHSIRTDDYQLYVSDADGHLEAAEPGPVRTLQGSILEVPGSSVRGGLQPDGLHVAMRLPGQPGRFWIQPVAGVVAGAAADAYVVYHDDDVLPHEGICGVDEAWLADKARFERETPVPGPPAESGGGGVAGADESCYWFAEIACDADNPYYLAHGSNVALVESTISLIINTMNDQYESEVDIHHALTTIIVRTSPVYSGTTSAQSLLNEFQNRWFTTHAGIPRDVAQLFTGRDVSGSVIGLAWTIGAICGIVTPYCLVESVGGGLAFQTDLSAHELGHLWGADHCNCPSNTMNATLLSPTNTFHPTETIPEIVAYRMTRQPICLVNDCIPLNDACANAITIGNGTTFFNNVNTYTDGSPETLCNTGGDSQVGSDVWFRYTADCDGPHLIDLCGSGFDTKVAVYQTSCPSGANQALACDDNSGCGNQAQLTLNATDGVTYVIRVGGFQGAQGNGILTITPPACVPPPGNNSCGSATPLSGGITAFTTLGATTDGPDEGTACDTGGGGQIDNDVWYRYVPGCDGQATVSLCDADYDTKVAVYGPFCPGGAGQVLACNDDACGLQSSVTFAVTSGSVYRIRVGGAGGATGSGNLNVTCGVGSGCPADTNGDDLVNVQDLLNIILDWGSDGSANGGDVNGDNIVNVQDLLDVILAWGACP